MKLIVFFATSFIIYSILGLEVSTIRQTLMVIGAGTSCASYFIYCLILDNIAEIKRNDGFVEESLERLNKEKSLALVIIVFSLLMSFVVVNI